MPRRCDAQPKGSQRDRRRHRRPEWKARPAYAAGMGELIPLFPLGTPLFPGVVLLLQIFEPRRRLMQDLAVAPESGDRRFFVAIRQAGRWRRSPRPRRSTTSAAPRASRRFARSPTAASGSSPWAGTVPPARRRRRRRPATAGRGRMARPGGGRGGGRRGLRGRRAERGCRGPRHVRGPAPRRRCGEVVASTARGSMEVLTRGAPAVHPLRVRGGRAQLRPRRVRAGRGRGRRDGRPGRGGRRRPAALSYLVASVALLTTEDRQALLAESATRRRLVAESRLLRRELTLLHDARGGAGNRCTSSSPR